MVALFAGLAMVAGVLTVTQLASSALEERNGGLGASECETTAPPEETDDNEAPEEGAAEEGAAEEGAEGGEEAAGETDGEAAEGEVAEDPAADGLTTTDELEAHVTIEDGVEHVHYRRYGWRGWDRDRGWDRGRDHGWHRPRPGPSTPPAECEEPTSEPTEEPTSEPTGEPGDPTEDPVEPTEDPVEPTEDPVEPTEDPGEEPEEPVGNQFDVFGRTCAENSAGLEIHSGAQSENAQCVETQMGAVPALENSPSLIISDAPAQVAVNEPFAIRVNTRNLVRDFFPPAGQSGYYRVNAFLNEEGLISGHFHLGCVLLEDPAVAPSPDALVNPQFFVAIEDGGGGTEPSDVDVQLAEGLPTAGEYRCTAWTGSASHAVPMLGFARMQIPADTVRIEVTG